MEEKKMSFNPLWEEIGIHRALGGFYYRSVIQLIALILMFLVGAVIVPALAPYPSVQGYRGVVNQMMGLTFTLFDVGIGSSIIRFIPEYRVKDLNRALQYASFFIWFQAFTGVIQITFISIWGLWYLPGTNISYTVWFILTYSLIQWPSSTGIFRDLLKAFQHHGKAQLIEILQNALVEVLTQVIFILIFREWGRRTPAYGELMGITIGWILGVMADDIICMIWGGALFQKVLNEVSGGKVNVFDVIRPNFTKEVSKEALVFGFQNMGASLLGAIQGTILVWVWVEILPSYAFYMGIVQLVSSLTMRGGGEVNTGLIPAFTESYNNGKTHLSRYYLANALKYSMFLMVFMNVLNFAVFPHILKTVLEITGQYFVIAATAIPIQVIIWNFDPFNSLTKDIIKNTGHVTLYFMLTGLNVLINLLSAFLFVFFLDIKWFILIAYTLPGHLAILVITLVYIQIKIIKWQVPKWQCFGAPLISGVVYYLFSHYFTQYVAPIFISLDPLGGAIIVLAISFLIIPFFIYMPLYTIFGGQDAQSMVDFEKAMLISGPSRILIRPVFKICKGIAKLNPFKLHDRFPIKLDGVLEDIEALMIKKNKIQGK
ncbi:MAG: hypothetical protein ACFFCS_26615 [Candidatus Hodarchaeota archaeon]